MPVMPELKPFERLETTANDGEVRTPSLRSVLVGRWMQQVPGQVRGELRQAGRGSMGCEIATTTAQRAARPGPIGDVVIMVDGRSGGASELDSSLLVVPEDADLRLLAERGHLGGPQVGVKADRSFAGIHGPEDHGTGVGGSNDGSLDDESLMMCKEYQFAVNEDLPPAPLERILGDLTPKEPRLIR